MHLPSTSSTGTVHPPPGRGIDKSRRLPKKKPERMFTRAPVRKGKKGVLCSSTLCLDLSFNVYSHGPRELQKVTERGCLTT